MQSAGLTWLVWTLTSSSLLLATVSVFQVVPLAILILPAGALIDRWPKRRTLLVTQSVFLLGIRVNGDPAARNAGSSVGPEIVEGLRSVWHSDTLRVTMAMSLTVPPVGGWDFR